MDPRAPPPDNPLQRIWRLADSSVRVRIIVPTAILFAITLAGMAYIAIATFDSTTRHEDHAANARSAASTANAVGERFAAASDGPHQLDDILPAGDVSGPSYVRVVGVSGRTLAQIGTLEDVAVAQVHALANEARCAGCHTGDADVLGWVHTSWRAPTSPDLMWDLGRVLALTGLPALLVLLGIAWWLLGREVVRPLDRLITSMRLAQQGKLAVADTGSTDELGDVAREFDATLAALRKSRSELETFYRQRALQVDRFAAMGELATGLAHEIKNPLAGMSGVLEILAVELANTPDRLEIVREMQHQVRRLTRTMDSMLGFARRPEPCLDAVDVRVVIDRVVHVVTQQVRKERCAVELRTEVAVDLPRALADPSQLEQALLNVSLNAIQSMRGAPGLFTLRGFEHDDRVVIEVEDTGPGVPESARAHIFEPYFTTKTTGTGLGLALTARIIADHDATIDYRCPDQGGTVFSIALRIAGTPTAQKVA